MMKQVQKATKKLRHMHYQKLVIVASCRVPSIATLAKMQLSTRGRDEKGKIIGWAPMITQAPENFFQQFNHAIHEKKGAQNEFTDHSNQLS